MTYNVKLSKQALSNIHIFLDRASLTGNEVPAFNEIKNALMKAVEATNVVPTEVPAKIKEA